MHLFPLLIAAAFSSQFVAPNEDKKIIVTPASITKYHTTIASLVLVPEDAAGWAETMFCILTATGGAVTAEATLKNTTQGDTWTAQADISLAPFASLTTDQIFPIKVEVSTTPAGTALTIVGEITQDLPEFSVSPVKVHWNANTKVTVEQKGDADPWTGDVAILVTATAPLNGIEQGWKPTTKIEGDDTVSYETNDAFDFSTVDLEATKPFYVWVKTGGGTSSNTEKILPAPVEIEADDKMGMTYTPIDSDSKELKSVVLTGPKGGFNADNNRVAVCIAEAKRVDQAAPICKVTSAEKTGGTNGVYTIGDIDLANVTRTPNSPIYAYAAYNTTDTPTYSNEAITIDNPGVLKFSVIPPSVSLTHKDIFDSITIVPKEGYDLGETIKVSINIKSVVGARASNEEILLPTVAKTDDVYVAKFDNAKWKGQKTPAVDNEYTVKVGTAETGAAYLGESTEFKIVAGADFTIDDEEIELKEWVNDKEFTLTKTGGWTGTTKVVISRNAYRTKADAADVVKTVEGTTATELKFKILTADINKLEEITPPTTLFVYAHSAETGLPAPVFFTINPTVPLFTIDPDTLEEEDLADPLNFNVLPKTGAGWEADKMKITFTLNDTLPTGTTIPFTFPLVAPTGATTDPWTVTGADLKDLSVTKDTKLIYVWVAKEGTYDAEYVTIAFTPEPPVPTTFTVTPNPTTKAEFDAGLNFTITQTAGTDWALNDNIFWAIANTATKTAAELAGLTAQKVFTVTTLKTATAEFTSTMAATVGTLTDNKIYVYAGINDSTHAFENGPVAVTVTAAAATTFVIAPAQVTWAADLKLEQTEIVPTPAKPADWPKTNDTISFRISPPATTAANIDPVKGKVIVIGTGDAAKWYIPKDTEIKTLVPTEPTADVTLKVEIALKDEEWLTETTTLKVKKTGGEDPEAAMGISPLLSLFAALVFLFVKLF